ncbi:unnamed protein product, partial [Adineta steineri]
MGFFIGDLHRQIEQLHQEQYTGTTAEDTFTVYRGQGLSTGDFEQMMETKDGLISFNNFLSTSKDRDVSYAFAASNQANPDLFGILFVIKVHPSPSTSPFASIAGINNAEDIYRLLLDQKIDDKNKPPIYAQLGFIKRDQGKYQEALALCEKSIAIYQKNLPPNHRDFAYSYGSIGLVHYNMGNSPKALSSLEKTLEIQQQSLPSNHPSIA